MMEKRTVRLRIGPGPRAARRAAGPPPSIDDIDGATFTVRASGVEYDLNGQRFKTDVTIEWTITKTGPTTVSLDTVLGGMSADASYVDGFLHDSVSGEFGSRCTPPSVARPGS